MPEIESKIGKTSIDATPLKTFVVDDPTTAAAAATPQPPNDPLPLKQTPGQWQRLTPEQFNRYRASLANSPMEVPQELMHATSSEKVLDNLGPRFDSEEDAAMISHFQQPIHRHDKMVDRKNVVEVLLGLKKKTATAHIDGHAISLRNLKSEETKRVLKAVRLEKDGFDQLYLTKHMVLAYALDSIDGETLEEALANVDSEKLRIDILANMDHSAVDELWEVYLKEINAAFSIRNETEAAEVASDIKK